QQMRRADRAGREDHLARRVDPLRGAATRELDPDRALAVEQHLMHQRLGDDLEVRPLFSRLQIGLRGAGAAAAAACLLAPADRITGAGREVVDVRAVLDAELLRRVYDRLAGGRPLG